MKSFLLLIVCMFVSFLSLAQNPIIDSLLLLVQQADKEARVVYFNQLAQEYYKTNLDSALHFQTQAFLLAKSTNNKEQQAYASNIIGEIYLERNEFTKSLSYFKQGYEVAEQAGSFIEMGTSINDMAALYSKWGDEQRALAFYKKALDIFEKHGSSLDKAIAYNNIGAQCLVVENYPKAIEYLKKAEVHIKNTQSNLDKAYIAVNFAAAYSELGRSDQALLNYERALKLYDQENDHTGVIVTLQSISWEWIQMGDYPRALSYLHKTENYKFLDDQRMAQYDLLSTIADSMRNYKQSLVYLKKYINLKDSIFKVKSIAAVSKMQAIYESDISKKENTELKQTIAETTQSNENQRNVILTVSALLALVVVLFIKIYLQFKDKKKQNKQLETQNVKIVVQNKQLINQREQIEKQKVKLEGAVEKLEQLDDFRKQMNAMLVHDLKNPLNSIIGLSEHELAEGHAGDSYELIFNAGKQMLQLVNNILDIERFDHVEVHLKLRNIDFIELIANVHEQIKYGLSEKALFFQTEVEAELKLNVDVILVERILTNLLTNAIKFSPEHGKILFRAKAKNGFVKIEIKDEGEGIKENNIKKVFDRFSHFSKDESTIRSSSGLGLTFCKLATEAHGGRIGVHSVYGEGATFWLTLPIAAHE